MRKLGKFYFLSKEKNVREVDMKKDVAELAKTFNFLTKVPWYIVGGVGTLLYLGKHYRRNMDFDIQLDIKDLPKFIFDIEKKGFVLVKRMMNKGQKFYPFRVFRKISPQKCYVGMKYVRLINPELKNSKLKEIDILYIDEGKEFTLFRHEGHELYFKDNPHGKTIKVLGQKVNLRNPNVHKAILKLVLGKGLDKNQQDLKELEKKT